MAHQQLEKFAEIVRQNKSAHFEIDNDYWVMLKEEHGEKICDSNDFLYDAKSYGELYEYGQGIITVLVHILNENGYKITTASV